MADSSEDDGDGLDYRKRPDNADKDDPTSPSSPPRGSGALLQASSPRNAPAGTASGRRDATGKTIVEVITYDKFDPNREYSGPVLKSAKYSGKWVPRFITLRDIDLTYAVAEGVTAKDTLRVFKVTRGAEMNLDPLSIVAHATSTKERKNVEFNFKCEAAAESNLWYLRLCHALSASNSMDMPLTGMPIANPKTGLPFVNIPMEHLAVFAPLDRLVLHFFAAATHRYIATGGISRMTEAAAFVFVGDNCLYVCDPQANIKRCVGVRSIKGIMTVASAAPDAAAATAPAAAPAAGAASPGKPAPPNPLLSASSRLAASLPMGGGTPGHMLVAFQCSMPEYDILLSLPAEQAERLIPVVVELHSHFGIPKSMRGRPDAGLKRVKLAKEKLLLEQLSLDPSDAYDLKIRLPMSRRYLLKMVADGVAGGQLVTVPKPFSLLAVTAPPPLPGGSAAAAAAAGGAAGAAASRNPLDQQQAPSTTPASAARPKLSDSDDSDFEGAAKKRNGKTTTNGAAGAATAKKPPVFDDSDDDFKPSPLAGAFGSTTASRNEAPSGAGGLGDGTTRLVGFGGADGVGPSPKIANGMIGMDKMHALLNAVGLPQYYAILTERGIDWEIFSCMSSIDLRKHGVSSVDHQVKIENALNDAELMKKIMSGASVGAPPPPPPGGAAAVNGAPPPPPPGGTGGGAAAGAPPPPAKKPIIFDDDDL